MELKSILKVYNEADLSPNVGSRQGITTKRLVGNQERPSERIFVTLATISPGASSHFHWHLVERLYLVVSGQGVVRDIEGKSHNIGPGSVVYAPPGIEGSHKFDAQEQLRLITISATTDPEKSIELTVDEDSKTSTIPLSQIVMRMGNAKFRSVY